jgi:hypothetical protein
MPKKKKKDTPGPAAPIMRKAKVHSNEDLKAYSRKQTKKDERDAKGETGS